MRVDFKNLIPLLIILLLPIYIFTVNSLPSDITYGNCSSQTETGETENVGFCTKVSATVQRDYYIGLVNMKTRVLGMNIDPVTKLMPWVVVFLSAASYRFFKQG